MSFQQLQNQLIEVLRDRIRNGEITERRLAKITGVSQPHMHNVLKGARVLSPDISDRILRGIRLSVHELWRHENASIDPGVPVLDDPAGPEHPYPRESFGARYPFPGEIVSHLRFPAVFRLARDPQMEPDLRERDRVLVDRSHVMRRLPDRESLYVIGDGGCALVRYVRHEGSQLYLGTAKNRHSPSEWNRVDLGDRDILEVIRGRIVWICRQMEKSPGPAHEAGAAPGPPGGA